MKKVADTLTAMRFVMGAVIAYIGVTRPDTAGLKLAVWLTLAAWTTDWLDGPIARRSRFVQQTWLGYHDLEADLCITLAMGVTLASWRMYVPVVLAIGLLAAWLLWRYFYAGARGAEARPGVWSDHSEDTEDSAFLQLMMAVIDGGFLYLIWTSARDLFVPVLIWVAASAILNPRRSWERVRGFLTASKKAIDESGNGEPR